MVKWRNDGAAVPAAANTGWDINLDGMRHVGMLPDLVQDMRNTGVSWEMLTPMFNAAEDYIRKSILNPAAFVVDGFAEGQMLDVWEESLSPGQVDALVDYLLTLEDG